MNQAIREKRKIRLENSVITPTIIKEVARLIDHEVRNMPDEQLYLINYSVDATDDSSYESQHIDIFNTPAIIDLKTLDRIQMRLQTISGDKNIEVQFQHSEKDDHNGNYILVGGNNSVWVNGILAQLTDIVDSAELQPSYRKVLSMAALPLCIIANVLYFRFFYDLIQRNKYVIIEAFFTLGVPIVLIWIFDKLPKYVESLWPDVELQTGPNYMQLPAIKRKKLNWLLTAIVVPIGLALLYDIVKNWLKLF